MHVNQYLIPRAARGVQNRHMLKKPLITGAELGEKIKKALQAAGKSQGELADALGVTRQAVYGWTKTGRIRKPRMQALAEFTGKDLDYFLTDSDRNNLTKVALSEDDARAVRSFLTAPPELKNLWRAVAEKNDKRLVQIVKAYLEGESDGRKLIYNAARGAELIRDENAQSSRPETKPGSPHRKRS